MLYRSYQNGVLSTLVAAEKWPQKNFVIVDDVGNINKWTAVQAPQFLEPGLPQLLAAQVGINVNFQIPDYQQQVNLAQMIIVAVDVKTKQKGIGKRKRLDLNNWDREMRKILIEAQQAKVIVIKSRLPPDNAITALDNIINDVRPVNAVANYHHIYWVPEFFSADIVRDFYLATPVGWIANNQVIETSFSSGMVGAMGSNVILAIHSTVMNIMSQFCETLPNGDINEVQNIVGSDQRLNGNLGVSAGFGGAGLLRDLEYFTHLAELNQNKPAAQLFESVIKCNRKHHEDIVAKMLQTINTLQNKSVCILGFSYKENTRDVANSAAIEICKKLVLKGARPITIYDPQVKEEDVRECFRREYTQGPRERIFVAQNLDHVWLNTEVICFLQHKEQFDNLNWQHIYNQAQNHAPNQPERVVHLFDTCNVLQAQLQNIQQLNNMHMPDPMFMIHIIGRPTIRF
ncbi:hypothetical protein RND81_06G245300 [Saponaria officinalis]|uniref:UDP-glucose 6-dehydrogenase n=1 Tax=Saponaria officinalis TaxID=3572 RepID=A0AAW1KG20_SAPOF